MATLSRLYDRSADLLERTGEGLGHPLQKMKQRPWSTGGIVALILAAIGLCWMWPEIQRYIRIKRM